MSVSLPPQNSLPPTPEELDAALDKLARQISERGLSVPAVFFLEMNKPLTSIAHASAMVAAPSLKLLFGSYRTAVIEELLASRAHIEHLIQLIEHYAHRDESDGTPGR